MDIDNKLQQLDQIYSLHEAFTGELKKACSRGCSTCCTINVTLTTLEGIKIIQYLETSSRLDDLSILDLIKDKTRFQPLITTNRFAELCLKKEEIPEENNIPDWGICPFLKEDTCSIYEVRPMGCRSMMSQEICSMEGSAIMNDDVVTLNTVILQFLEHIDIPGFYGNLTDILSYLKTNDFLGMDGEHSSQETRLNILKNNQIKMLLVPPDHREKILPAIEKLQAICD